MQPRPENGNTLEPDAHADPTSTVGSQPWWRGVGYAAVPPNMLRESGSESPPLDLADGGEGSKGGQLQSENGINGAEDGSKGIQDMSKQTGSDGSYGQEHQNLQPVTSAMPPVIAEYLVPHTQLELGHSIACAPYSYSDTYYNALVTAYGTQALVHPQLLGMPHTRMPLPLEMAEEPVYVNAKQYHGILRRRQSRAKAELEKKLIKVRKPYLHESRHQHAMRRARGCGGRFLNTKKADGTAANPAAEKVGSSGEALQNCSGSQTPASVHPGNPRSGTATQVKGPTGHGMSEPHTYTNGNGGYQQRSGFQLSAFHSISGERGEEGDCSGQQRNGILVNRPQNRVVAIQ